MMETRHETFQAFGWPGTVIKDYTYWSVLVRPKQVTLGSMVLIAKSDAKAYSELSAEAFAEMHEVIADIEAAARQAFSYEKINYLMLMMKDPQVHAHVIPRYGSPKQFGETVFTDPGWPGPPDLTAGPDDAAIAAAVQDALLEVWPNN